jgi:hypothetical protein
MGQLVKIKHIFTVQLWVRVSERIPIEMSDFLNARLSFSESPKYIWLFFFLPFSPIVEGHRQVLSPYHILLHKHLEMDGDHVMALNKNLIEHLMEWKSIIAEEIGARYIVSLTDEGINALRFLRDINIVKEV